VLPGDSEKNKKGEKVQFHRPRIISSTKGFCYQSIVIGLKEYIIRNPLWGAVQQHAIGIWAGSQSGQQGLWR